MTTRAITRRTGTYLEHEIGAFEDVSAGCRGVRLVVVVVVVVVVMVVVVVVVEEEEELLSYCETGACMTTTGSRDGHLHSVYT
jgi:hypothetical protein